VKKALAVFVLIVAFALPGRAQLGLSLVSDPGEYTRMYTQLVESEGDHLTNLQKLALAITLYNMTMQQLQQITNMVQNYRIAFAHLGMLSGVDNYGTITPLMNAANSGQGAAGGYYTEVYPLNYMPLNGMPQAEINSVQTQYGDQELRDGMNQNDWTLIGNVRANSQANIGNLLNLLMDALHPGSTTMQVAQRTSASAATQVQQLGTMQELQAAQLEQQVMAAQAARNAQAEALDTDVDKLTLLPLNADQAAAGLASGLQGYNFPD
jgi:hypothetical protein